MEKVVNVAFIKSLMQENGLSESEFCEKCNITSETLRKILSNDLSLPLDEFFKIARAMRISVTKLFLY